MITQLQLDRAKLKAQELWNKYYSEDAENIIKREIFSEIISDEDPDAENKLKYLNQMWAEVKAYDQLGYWGFDAVAIEFCKMIERSLKLREFGIL